MSDIVQNLQRFSPYAVDGGADAYGQMEEDNHGDYFNREDVLAAFTALEAQTANQAAAIALLERDIADTWALVNEKDQEIAKIRRDLDTANHQVERLLALSNSMDGDFKAEVAKLSDPNSVQINMLMGRIAKPTFAQMQFVYAAEFREAQRAADALADGVAGKLDILAADFPQATSLFRDLVAAYLATKEPRT